jgi:hypothetical protein
MDQDRRNPYLILGVDYGADKKAASRSFARASRRIKRSTDTPYTIEDLTWALSEIEGFEGNPQDLVSLYRVPADPGIFAPAAVGLLNPPPVVLERRTALGDEDALVSCERGAARELLRELLTRVASRIEIPSPL